MLLFGSLDQCMPIVADHDAGPLVERHGRKIRLNMHHLDRSHAWFERWGAAAVFFGRMLPVVRTFISLPAGIARMNFAKFVFYTTLGCIPWVWGLTLIGKHLGPNYQDARGSLHRQLEAAQMGRQEDDAAALGPDALDALGLDHDTGRRLGAQPQTWQLGDQPARMAHGGPHVGKAIARLARVVEKASAVGGRDGKHQPTQGGAQAMQKP